MLELRKQVYEANMELYRNHLAPLTWGNVSQVDRSLGVMAIKPSGVPYERLSAEDITVVSLETRDTAQGAWAYRKKGSKARQPARPFPAKR